MNRNQEKYYAQRASEYDRIYEKPERFTDLAKLKHILCREFAGLDVLEIACGTGYWTQYIAQSAKSILATDVNLEMIHLARQRDYRVCYMSFGLADAYVLSGIDTNFDGGFAGFFWSHVPRQRRADFLCAFHSHLNPGAKVMLVDGRYVEGSSTPIARRDESGNTYQIRQLDDGSIHEVIKNYPSEDELKNDFAPYCAKVSVTLLQYFWLMSYQKK